MSEMKFKTVAYDTPKNILALTGHEVAIAGMHAKATAQTPGNAVLVDGRYVLKAGTIYPANDETAVGVIANNYDVTDGAKSISIIVHGFIKTSAIPEEPTAEAKLALTGIQFVPIVPVAQEVASAVADAIEAADIPGAVADAVAAAGALVANPAAFQAASTAVDVAGVVANLNTLIAALKTAGIMAAE